MNIYKPVAYLKNQIHLKQWELAKYAIVSCVLFSPALVSAFKHLENEYYRRIDSLLAFLAFSITTFAILVLFKIHMKWTIPFALFAIICDAYHLAIGKPIGFQTMAAMYETNPDEMLGFMSSPYSLPLFLGGAIALSLLVWYLLRPKPLWGLRKETSIRRIHLLVLPVVALALFAIEGKTILFTYPIDIFYLNFNYIEESHARKVYLDTPYVFTRSDPDRAEKPGLFVLIIGEAARRTALHAYGSKWDTSPKLDAFIAAHPDNVILFTSAISGSAYTRGSVPTTLSTFDLKDIKHLYKRPSLTKIFRGAGFKTLYVTTRPKYLFPNIVSTFQDDAEQHVYLSTLQRKAYDEEDIPVLESFIAEHDNLPKFAVVHLMGSHIEYSRQYPKAERHFHTGHKMWDTYHDSIRYSDKVIDRVAALAMAKEYPAFVLYASDHGENLNDYGDHNFGHGTKEFTKFEFEIPFMVLFNDAFAKRFPDEVERMRAIKNAPINQDYISHTLLGLANLKDSTLYRPDHDLSDTAFKTHKRWIIDENMNFYDFDSLRLDRRKIKNNVEGEYNVEKNNQT